jgi:hypothetical protein
MAGQANEPILQLQAEVLALQEEAAIAAAAAAAAATAATATTTAAVQQAAGAARSPPVFTLASALANAAAFLDLTGSSGAKRFKGATESLSFQPFDFEENSDPQVLLDLVLTKSQEVWGWNTIFNVPVTDAATGAARNWNLLSHHGMAQSRMRSMATSRSRHEQSSHDWEILSSRRPFVAFLSNTHLVTNSHLTIAMPRPLLQWSSVRGLEHTERVTLR